MSSPTLLLRKTDAQLRIERDAAIYALAVEALWSRAGNHLESARTAASLVAPRTIQVAAALMPNGQLDPARLDTGSNLILLERCLAAALHAVDSARDHLPDSAIETFFSAHRQLRRVLDPLFIPSR